MLEARCPGNDSARLRRESCPIALEELLGAVRQESERVERLEQAIRDAVP
jgi:hypothetical protein